MVLLVKWNRSWSSDSSHCYFKMDEWIERYLDAPIVPRLVAIQVSCQGWWQFRYHVTLRRFKEWWADGFTVIRWISIFFILNDLSNPSVGGGHPFRSSKLPHFGKRREETKGQFGGGVERTFAGRWRQMEIPRVEILPSGKRNEHQADSNSRLENWGSSESHSQKHSHVWVIWNYR